MTQQLMTSIVRRSTLGLALGVLLCGAGLAQAQDVSGSTGLALDGSVGMEDLSPSVPNPEAAQDLAACERGDAGACYALGVRYHGGNGVTRDNIASIAWIRFACDAGHGPACYELGARHLLGDYVEESAELGRRWIDHACELDYGVACGFGATLHRDGIGGRRDVEVASRLMARGCALGYLDACQQADPSVELGAHERALPETAGEQVQHAARQCDRGLQGGCAALATAYLEGDTVPADAERAREIFWGACNWGLLPACIALGR